VPGILSRPEVIRLRSALRSHPVAHRATVAALNSFHRSREHEAAFGRAISATVVAGDCVWDVGANVGHYTSEFLRLVGSEGRVVAFDPDPSCARRLDALGSPPQLRVVEAAVADFDGETTFSVAAGEASYYNHIGVDDAALTVRAARGTTLVAEGVPAPTVVKIDVEGWEGEVLDGLGDLVDGIRAFFIEVHFRILGERGKPLEPTRICSTLSDRGFAISWTDRSHFVAERR
jgi:FkbM family methyltransferase